MAHRAELGVYTEEYGRTGFQGALQAYRVCSDPDLNAELRLFSGKTIDVPSLFIGGKSDWGTYSAPGAVDLMRTKAATRMGGIELIDGAGHWVQQGSAQHAPARLHQGGRITPAILDLAVVSPDDAIIFVLPITTREHASRPILSCCVAACSSSRRSNPAAAASVIGPGWRRKFFDVARLSKAPTISSRCTRRRKHPGRMDHCEVRFLQCAGLSVQ
jgi:hypothetical protein